MSNEYNKTSCLVYNKRKKKKNKATTTRRTTTKDRELKR
jgi:hypothetical protein